MAPSGPDNNDSLVPGGAIGAALIIIVISLTGAAALLASISGEDFEWREPVARSLLSLTSTVLVTGFLGALIYKERRNQEKRDAEERQKQEKRDLEERRLREKREDDAHFVEAQVVKLWDARAALRTASVLIATHQSAKTYGEQVRELITVRGDVMNVRGAVRRRAGSGLTFERHREFLRELESAVTYLSSVIDEYQEHYPAIASLQRLDEARNDEVIKANTFEGDPRKSVPEALSRLAWQAINERGDPDWDLQFVRQMIDFGTLNADKIRWLTNETGKELDAFGREKPARRKSPNEQPPLDESALMPIARAATLLERVVSKPSAPDAGKRDGWDEGSDTYHASPPMQ